MTVLFGLVELPSELFGALCGILAVITLQLAWHSTRVRNQRIIRRPETILMIERTGTLDSLRARVTLYERRSNSTETEVLTGDESPADERRSDHERIISAMDASLPSSDRRNVDAIVQRALQANTAVESGSERPTFSQRTSVEGDLRTTVFEATVNDAGGRSSNGRPTLADDVRGQAENVQALGRSTGAIPKNSGTGAISKKSPPSAANTGAIPKNAHTLLFDVGTQAEHLETFIGDGAQSVTAQPTEFNVQATNEPSSSIGTGAISKNTNRLFGAEDAKPEPSLVVESENVQQTLPDADSRPAVVQTTQPFNGLDDGLRHRQRAPIPAWDNWARYNNTEAEVPSWPNENNRNVTLVDDDTSDADATNRLPSTTVEPDTGESRSAEQTFRVKLKYLNDDMKIASGKPSEPIGEFTRRNFAAELADNKNVRLIFNGQVLRPESKTLRACGMFADCVVHCLIRAGPSNAADTPGEPNASAPSDAPQTQLGTAPTTMTDLGGILPDHRRRLAYLSIGLLELAFSVVWTARFRFAHLFTLFSTIGLVLLTIMFGAIATMFACLLYRPGRLHLMRSALMFVGIVSLGVCSSNFVFNHF